MRLWSDDYGDILCHTHRVRFQCETRLGPREYALLARRAGFCTPSQPGEEARVLDRLLLLDEVAAHLKCSSRQVEKLIAGGHLASLKVGRHRVVRESALADFVEEREHRQGERV